MCAQGYVTDVDKDTDTIVVQSDFIRNYLNPGIYVAFFQGCCRPNTLVNNPNSPWRLETTVVCVCVCVCVCARARVSKHPDADFLHLSTSLHPLVNFYVDTRTLSLSRTHPAHSLTHMLHTHTHAQTHTHTGLVEQ
jgi:hypothetical protein